MQHIKFTGVFIPSIDGKDAFLSNHYINKTQNGYNIRDTNDNLILKKFKNTLDYSLDLIKLREVYQKTYRRKDFSFIEKGKEYTTRVINMTFKYNVKAYNCVGKGLYIKFGYSYNECNLKDCVYIKNGELIAIQTYIPSGNKDWEKKCRVSHPISKELLGKYFYCENGFYKAKNNIKTLKTVADIRLDLYQNGFVCDGVKYVRFKRSSGSSRVGKCLFIDERLCKPLTKWSQCGLDIKRGQSIDLASLEPYTALTLSSIIDTVKINANNILIIDDYNSVFKDKVLATKLVDSKLKAGPERAEISNNIWDGQSLLDESMFGQYSNHGMLLLRARFFKSCCFNTNIQQWFKDNDITDVSQLNGFTLAKDIADIKLITTPSSIKYLKFGTLKDWLWTLDSIFGIVKYDKPTQYFNGDLVQCHYQLLNTIQLSYEEVGKLLEPSFDYLRQLKTNPVVLRHHIKYRDQDVAAETPLTSKNDIIYKLLGLNENFSKTKLYYQFCKKLFEAFIRNLRKGHLLISGNYSTLFGNPLEMLKMSIGVFDGSSDIGIKQIHCTKFKDGELVLGSRSPHVANGNILLAKNKINNNISKYFNLTNEIVCINSIGENILERLSGADFDADTMLLTNNKILLDGAKRNYDKFLVPTKMVSALPRHRKYTPEDQADLDIKTSDNKIGEIINLSQEITSKLWDLLSKSPENKKALEMYNDISKLDVMSNLEIDSAKKENPANNAKELTTLKKKYETRDDEGRYIRPLFFKYIDKYKGYYDKNRKAYKQHNVTMDYLQVHISKFRLPYLNNQKFLIFSDILIKPTESDKNINRKQVKKILKGAQSLKATVADIWNKDSGLSGQEKYFQVLDVKQEYTNTINEMSINESTMYYLLTLLEDIKYSDVSGYLFTLLFGIKNESFYELIRKSKAKVKTLIRSDDDKGEFNLYGINFTQV